MKRILNKPVAKLDLELSQDGIQILKFPCWISENNRWWVSEDVMASVFGCQMNELKSLQNSQKTIFVREADIRFYELKEVVKTVQLIKVTKNKNSLNGNI